MSGVRGDLIVPLDGDAAAGLRACWRWLVPDACRPLFATALGDLFLSDPDGRVLWLDMGTGRLQPVAADAAAFARSAADPDHGDFWFGQPLVDRLRAAGRCLGPGECYSYVQLPMLGGGYEPGNFRVYDLSHHLRVWGPIHERLRHLPDGATVAFDIVD